MLIVSAYTQNYSEKIKPLRESLKDVDHRIYFFEAPHLQSYRELWPLNRPVYACPQGGEFVDWLDVPDDEIIIWVDADTVMNGQPTKAEVMNIKARLKHNDILSVYGAYPPTSLFNVLQNIGYAEMDLEPFPGADWFLYPEFTASFLVATKATFRKLRDLYLKYFDAMAAITGHHAGTQWLINWICYNHFKVGILPKTYQCGSWYDGCTEQDASIAVFNHTK
jgi:hypothetical protein